MRVAMPQRQLRKNGFLERAARENPVAVASQSSPREISPESVRRGASPASAVTATAGRGSPPPGAIDATHPDSTQLMNKHNLPPVLRLERLGELLFRSFQRSPQPINSPSIILGLELQRTNLRTGRSRPLSRRRRLQIIINRRCQR